MLPPFWSNSASLADPAIPSVKELRKVTPVRPRTAVSAALLAAATIVSALIPAHAVSGDPAPAGSYAFAANLAIGSDETARACTGSLVAPQWILTAASCFASDPETATVAAGAPALKTTATVSGKTGAVTELVPRPGRDVVLARLVKPLTGIAPVALSATPVTGGEQLRATGFGRARNKWVPGVQHTATLTVDSVGVDDIAATGVSAALCKGDAGGPLLRETGGRVEMVAVNSRSWQGGCFGEKETRTGAVASRSDNLAAWVTETVTAGRPLTNTGTKRCLAVPLNSVVNGTGLVQWTCVGGSEQKWHLEKAEGGNGDRYLVRNSNSKKCVAMPRANIVDDTQAIQWSCSGDNEQVWIHDSINRMRNLHSDKCLAISDSTTAIGAKVVQRTCATSSDQKWVW